MQDSLIRARHQLFGGLLCLSVYLLMVLPSDALAQSTEIDLLIQRITPDFVADQQRRALALNSNLVQRADDLLSSQQASGSWTDINYQDRSAAGWSPSIHLDNVLILSAAYFDTARPELASAANLALSYWYQVNPTSTNWWWGEIGTQLRYGPASLLLGNQLTTANKTSILGDLPPAPYKTGANRTDISKAVIWGGLLDNDNARVASGLSGIAETIMVTTAEGVQPDYSFHQHGPLLHNASYGKVFFNTAVYWAYQVRDLSWAFSPEQNQVLSAYFLDGDRWMTRGFRIDYSTGGRSIAREAGSINTLAQYADYVAAIDPSRAHEAQAFAAHALGGPVGLDGVRHYWRSDYSVMQRDKFQFTLHMHSNRVRPTETGNGENMLGKWLGYGNTFLRMTGDEYHNIFPVWNWARLPGITAPEIEGPGLSWGASYQATSFVGGVTDGQVAASVMDINHNGLQAKKAWFMFNDEIVALGAGISYSGSEYVNTTVEQSLLNGPVTVDGVVQPVGERELVNAQWVHHNQVGYLFLQNWYGHQYNQDQSGSWARINTNLSADPVTAGVFQLRIGHSWNPRNRDYAYVLYPGRSASETQVYASNPAVHLLENSAQIQAVTHDGLGKTGVIFHQAGRLVVNANLAVSVDKPAALLLDLNGVEPVISLSTPGAGGVSVNVTLEQNGTTLQQTVVSPSGASELGKTLTFTFNGGPPPSTVILNPVADAFVRGGQYQDTNYGSTTYMPLKNVAPDYDRKAYLKWDLGGLSTNQVAQAVLRIAIVNITNNDSQVAIEGTADNWLESSLTWRNAPVGDTPVASTSVSIGNTHMEVDVTDYINQQLLGDGVVSLLLRPISVNHYVAFASKERGYPAELIITMPALAPLQCDTNGDAQVDTNDIRSLASQQNRTGTSQDSHLDINQDGQIGLADARLCSAQCTYSRCAIQQ